MYSEEIKRLLEIRGNLVTLKEYIKIIESPQVDHVLYKDNKLKIWTNDNSYFKLRIRKE